MIAISDELAQRLASPYRKARDAACRELRTMLDCDHEWTDDGEFIQVCTNCGLQEDREVHELRMQLRIYEDD